MFPTLLVRLLVAATIFLGGWVLVSAAGTLHSADGSGGLTLMMSHAGVLPALLIVLVAAIPAIAMSLLCSSIANPLTGIFSLTTALWFLSAKGDTIDAWIRRNDASLPGDYMRLAMEVILWAAMLTGFIFLITLLRPRIRTALPMLAREPHLGEEPTLRRSWLPVAVSTLVTAIVAGILASFLLRTPDKGQIIGGLILSFMVGGLVGDLACTFLFQRHPANPMGLILAPSLVAITGYLLAVSGYRDGTEFLKAYYDTKAAGLALALPMDYASAGVAGCALGAGWAQVMLHGEQPMAATVPTVNPS